MTQILLRVTGPGFVTGAVFEKTNGQWEIVCCAPYLRKIIGKTPVSGLKQLFTDKGFTFEWRKGDQNAQDLIPTLVAKRS